QQGPWPAPPATPSRGRVEVMRWYLPRPAGRSWLRRAQGASSEGGEFARKVSCPEGFGHRGRVREAQQRVRSARARALVAKRGELAAHERAIKRHEEAAAVQERFGHPDRAANAREHARHARELRELLVGNSENGKRSCRPARILVSGVVACRFLSAGGGGSA